MKIPSHLTPFPAIACYIKFKFLIQANKIVPSLPKILVPTTFCTNTHEPSSNVYPLTTLFSAVHTSLTSKNALWLTLIFLSVSFSFGSLYFSTIL